MKQDKLVFDTVIVPFLVSLAILSVLLIISVVSESVTIVDYSKEKVEQMR
ncbi:MULTISPECIES: hypothetical protein [unclassified Granulicatella]|nr:MULTISPECIES: hypothetical protein [unclassified Granulicatella]MBF0779808.1 hypothetical protein [Granulicatella sp. 19428wC4_WM01]